jgi:hypothetical protein
MSALPPKPNLEQLKKQAKDRRKAHKVLYPEAVIRIREHLPRLADHSEQDILKVPFSLQEAQHVIARENGFRSWRELHAAAVSGATLSAEDGSETGWRSRFAAIYRLQPDQSLLRVAPPFISERLEYFITEHPRQAATNPEPYPPETIFFDWDGERLQGDPGMGWDGWRWVQSRWRAAERPQACLV